MINFTINPDKFDKEVQCLPENLSKDKYIKTYPYLLNYFKKDNDFEINDFIVGCHAIYGWMPTILEINLNGDESEIIEIINKAKHSFIDSDSIGKLKVVINNSLVGTSKLLHFINPNEYAVWDSKILHYFSGNKSSYGVDNIGNYENYLQSLKYFSKSEIFKQLKPKIASKCGDISDLRAIEVVLFHSVTKKSK